MGSLRFILSRNGITTFTRLRTWLWHIGSGQTLVISSSLSVAAHILWSMSYRDECLDSDNGKKNGKGNCNGSITLYQASLNCNVAAGFLFATFATNAEQNYQKTTASKILMKRKEKGEREIGEKDNGKGEIRVQAN